MKETGLDRWQRRSGAIVLASIASLLIALSWRLVQINTVLGPRLLLGAGDQYSCQSAIPARRGTIFDTKGRILAGSRPKPDVFVDPARAVDIEELARELAPRVSLPADDLIEKVRSSPSRRFVVVARGVDDVTAGAVLDMHNPAVGLTESEVRFYPLGSSLAPVLGFVGRDGDGLEGLELAHNDHLKGRNGRRAMLCDAARRPLRPSTDGTTPPVDGGHVVLTIDAEIQGIAHGALSGAISRFEAESGVALVMSPPDGRILAMVNLPSYDPHQPSDDPPHLRRNRAVTDPVEPGSTFKPVVACGALAGGFITPQEVIDCGMGSHRFGGRLVSDVSPHGMMDILGIIAQSSNVGIAKVAERMGNEALYETVRRFGFGRQTGIGFPGENSGLVYELRHWTSLSAASISFGYELGVTPIQLATAFSAIVNGGWLVRPRIVEGYLQSDGRATELHAAPGVVRRAIPAEVARYMSKIVLPAVVEEGSGKRAGSALYRVMGKTGTAKLPYADRRGYEPGAYQSTFVGAAPVDDPSIVVLVMIRRPNPAIGYYGGTVAAPCAGKIIEAALAYSGIPPDREKVATGW